MSPEYSRRPLSMGIIMYKDYVIRAACATWVIATVLLGGCREDEPSKKSTSTRSTRLPGQWTGSTSRLSDKGRRAIRALETSLQEAQTDEQKWQIVAAKYNLGLDDDAFEEQVKSSIAIRALSSDIIWAYYPGIRRKFDWTAADLEHLGRRIGRIDVWDRHHAARHPQSGIRAPLLDTDTLSREILYHLTGERFASRDAFTEWFLANKASLQWDEGLGRFRSSPSTTRRGGP